MLKAQLLMAAFAASYFGSALLALSLSRHWSAVTGQQEAPPCLPTRLRIAGYLGLALSGVAALLRDGPSFGVLLWITLLAAGGVAVALTLTWRSQCLRLLATVACRLVTNTHRNQR